MRLPPDISTSETWPTPLSLALFTSATEQIFIRFESNWNYEIVENLCVAALHKCNISHSLDCFRWLSWLFFNVAVCCISHLSALFVLANFAAAAAAVGAVVTVAAPTDFEKNYIRDSRACICAIQAAASQHAVQCATHMAHRHRS